MNSQEQNNTDWANARIGDVCEIIRGVTYKKAQAKSEPCPDVLPIVRATNIQENELKLDDDLVYVPKELVAERQRLKVGDIVVATSSGSKHLVGKTAQLKEQWAGSFGAFCAAIRPSKPLNDRYIGYYFDSPFYRKYIAAKSSGVNINNLRRGDLEEIVFPIAPLDQQKRIVEEIEKQFSRLDEAVANLKRVKANLKRYKTSVLQAAVTGKLTEAWRKQHAGDVEPASKLLERILAERRRKWEETELAKMRAKGKEPKNDKWKEKYKEPTAPDVTNLSTLSDGWVFTRIEQILPSARDSMKTGPFGSLLKKHEHQCIGVPVLGIENIQSMKFVFGSKIHVTEDKARDLEGYKVAPGDILISRSGTVGEVCVVPEGIGEARISTNLMKISLVTTAMLPDFFTFLFNGSPFVLSQVSELCKGSTRDFLNQEILKRIIFVLPSIEEQQVIVQEVERQLSVAEEIERTVDVNLKRAERLRQSILKQAFSGKLV